MARVAPDAHLDSSGSDRVITISITADAFAAIAATLPSGSKADVRPDGKGGYLITLPPRVIDALKAMRGPGESYSDVIIRIARVGP
jgi:hypothetical protein